MSYSYQHESLNKRAQLLLFKLKINLWKKCFMNIPKSLKNVIIITKTAELSGYWTMFSLILDLIDPFFLQNSRYVWLFFHRSAKQPYTKNLESTPPRYVIHYFPSFSKLRIISFSKNFFCYHVCVDHVSARSCVLFCHMLYLYSPCPITLQPAICIFNNSEQKTKSQFLHQNLKKLRIILFNRILLNAPFTLDYDWITTAGQPKYCKKSPIFMALATRTRQPNKNWVTIIRRNSAERCQNLQ